MFNQLESLHFVLYRICTEFRPSADPSNDPLSGLKERFILGSNLHKISEILHQLDKKVEATPQLSAETC
jgi:hypothetical protein